MICLSFHIPPEMNSVQSNQEEIITDYMSLVILTEYSVVCSSSSNLIKTHMISHIHILGGTVQMVQLVQLVYTKILH